MIFMICFAASAVLYGICLFLKEDGYFRKAIVGASAYFNEQRALPFEQRKKIPYAFIKTMCENNDGNISIGKIFALSTLISFLHMALLISLAIINNHPSLQQEGMFLFIAAFCVLYIPAIMGFEILTYRLTKFILDKSKGMISMAFMAALSLVLIFVVPVICNILLFAGVYKLGTLIAGGIMHATGSYFLADPFAIGAALFFIDFLIILFIAFNIKMRLKWLMVALVCIASCALNCYFSWQGYRPFDPSRHDYIFLYMLLFKAPGTGQLYLGASALAESGWTAAAFFITSLSVCTPIILMMLLSAMLLNCRTLPILVAIMVFFQSVPPHRLKIIEKAANFLNFAAGGSVLKEYFG